MNLDAEKFYALLPEVYRLRDHAEGEPLKALLAVVFDQIANVQEGIEQGYDDLFIETCAEWVTPYLGDLIGARLLHATAEMGFSARAQVANTLAFRRRKGTLAVIEQLARDVTQYPAAAVEFFQQLAVTQHVNHPRAQPLATLAISKRGAENLDRLATAFDRAAHTFEARRIASGRGRYNIPNIGIFLFRLRALPLTLANAVRVDDFRYLFNPLGFDMPLFNDPQEETAIEQFAEPRHAPIPLTRHRLRTELDTLYGRDGSLAVEINGALIPANRIVVCDLSDQTGGTWAHTPQTCYAIDPLLGRLALPNSETAPASDQVLVSFRYGFNDAIGGGEYDRDDSEATPQELAAAATVVNVANGTGLDLALGELDQGGLLQFKDSRTYDLAAATLVPIAAGARFWLRAQDGARPLIRLAGGNLILDCGDDAEIVLDGLVFSGGALEIRGNPKSVSLRDCTLTPGVRRDFANEPVAPTGATLLLNAGALRLERCITGRLQLGNTVTATIERSIVDATAPQRIALSADAAFAASGALTLTDSTVIGRIHAQRVEISNCILLAAAPTSSSAAPVWAEQIQAGCVRFTYLPRTARVPRRYRCQPANDADANRVAPAFTSLRFGAPGYCQLTATCPREIRLGAEDEAEMGVFHALQQAQRETNLRVRLDEYLRFGLEAGIFYAN